MGAGAGQRERNRRLNGVGLTRRSDTELQRQALHRIEAFLAWIRRQPCVVLGQGTDVFHEYFFRGVEYRERLAIEAAHDKTRGSHGPDFGNAFPLHWRIHRWQEDHADADFAKAFGKYPEELAAETLARYERTVLLVSL
jgi:hypothetical protein